MKSINDIEHVIYINLLHRTDRKQEVEEELKTIGFVDKNVQRFNAISTKNGRVGCTMSHLKCLQEAKKNNWSHLMLVEDDIQFLDPTLFVTQLNDFLSANIDWDVILIAGNNLPPYTRIRESAIKVMQCQTTTGYIIKNTYFDTLIENIRDGLAKLLKEPENHYQYAIDKYWFRLQQRDKWFLITPLSVTQRAGYSDIEQKHTDFTKALTDLDKEELMKRYNAMRMNASRMVKHVN